MITHETSIGTSQTLPKVVIDWSDALLGERPGEGDAEVESLISWVVNYPQRSDIHVYLRSMRNDRAARSLQNRLLSLGCRVTIRSRAVTAVRISATPEDGWNADFGLQMGHGMLAMA